MKILNFISKNHHISKIESAIEVLRDNEKNQITKTTEKEQIQNIYKVVDQAFQKRETEILDAFAEKLLKNNSFVEMSLVELCETIKVYELEIDSDENSSFGGVDFKKANIVLKAINNNLIPLGLRCKPYRPRIYKIWINKKYLMMIWRTSIVTICLIGLLLSLYIGR